MLSSGRRIARLWPDLQTDLLIVPRGQAPRKLVLPDQAALPDPRVKVVPSRGHVEIHVPTREWNGQVVQLLDVQLIVGRLVQPTAGVDRRVRVNELVATLAWHRVASRSR